MNKDLLELLNCLKSQNVDFLIIGAHAVGFHSRPRMTQDIDLWIDRSPLNVEHLQAALEQFGTPIGADGAKRFSELERQMVRIGAPPNMVDLLNFAGKASFKEVYANRIQGTIDGVDLFFPSVEDLIQMKADAGRPQDIADIDRLKRTKSA